MRVIIDVEANSLKNPTKIWCIVCKDVDTGDVHVYRHPSDDPSAASAFIRFANNCTCFIGHNLIGYDLPAIRDILGYSIVERWKTDPADVRSDGYTHCDIIDTFIISHMVDYSKRGHSIEAYGLQFGLEKVKFNDFKQWSQELEDYCIRDVEINFLVYKHFRKFLYNPQYSDAISLEHQFALVTNALTRNGFSFNTDKATVLLQRVERELAVLDKDILDAFPPREVIIREFVPKLTKYGTISRTSVPRQLHDNIHLYEVGRPYKHTRMEEFNPSSHKQLVDVLSEAGWRPVDKTKTHLETEREANKLKRLRNKDQSVDLRLQSCYTSLSRLGKYGWQINENNLATLPADAPAPARFLAKRILLESRRRTLTEWLSLVGEDGRIHGEFLGIGAWTHRMAHRKPNTANIPNEFDQQGKKKLLGKEMRSLWCAPKNRLLVGVDAEGIQLRIFAHYIDDAEFTDALVRGKKDDKTDPHSLNQRILGRVCRTRQAAKRFIYALLLGGGLGQLAKILDCTEAEAGVALERILARYQGFAYLKENVIPLDARRGWFVGLDGRRVPIPADTEGGRRHLCMSGYLQNGEAIIMKKATLLWHDKLEQLDALLVNFVHDEWQIECPNDMRIAEEIARQVADSLRIVGNQLKLRCPLAGSYWNDDLKDFTIATNWAYTH